METLTKKPATGPPRSIGHRPALNTRRAHRSPSLNVSPLIGCARPTSVGRARALPTQIVPDARPPVLSSPRRPAPVGPDPPPPPFALVRAGAVRR